MNATLADSRTLRPPATALVAVFTFYLVASAISQPVTTTPPAAVDKTTDAAPITSQALSALPIQDKNQFTLWNMTPLELRRPFSTATDFGALGAHTVDPGAIVADVGFGYGYRSRSFGAADRTDESWNLGRTWLKAGICNHLDFEVGLPLWQIHTQTLKDPTGHDSNTSDGFGDFETRLKYTLWGNDTGPDTFAVAGTVKYPTTTYDKSRDDYEGGLTALFEYLCPCDLDMRINSGFRLSDDPCWESCFDNRISFTHPLILIDKLYAQASFNSTVSTARNSNWDGEFQTGLIYQPTPDCQIYLGTSFGVNGSADDYGLRLDVAYRF